MNPAAFNTRISIYKVQNQKDPRTKLPTKITEFLTKTWAEVIDTSAKMFFQAAAAHLEYATLFKIPYTRNVEIKSGYEVEFEGIMYTIELVKPDLKTKKSIMLQCKEVI
ncbi:MULTISPECIES: phage head closure protein [Bacillus]|uniref:phage head closure protein n=1 Tax=Bacillus TaxID=1386 RepID=UPI0014287AA8|nr:phage head closure protein [Bacillus velezensis]MEC1700925.1 phage head closure protein [Bacillus velezensis]QIR33252.1 Phage head-tail joining protein [Bacillus velezensis]